MYLRYCILCLFRYRISDTAQPSDRYGRKPLFVLPVIGSIIGHCFSIVNYAYIR